MRMCQSINQSII